MERIITSPTSNISASRSQETRQSPSSLETRQQTIPGHEGLHALHTAAEMQPLTSDINSPSRKRPRLSMEDLTNPTTSSYLSNSHTESHGTSADRNTWMIHDPSSRPPSRKDSSEVSPISSGGPPTPVIPPSVTLPPVQLLTASLGDGWQSIAESKRIPLDTGRISVPLARQALPPLQTYHDSRRSSEASVFSTSPASSMTSFGQHPSPPLRHAHNMYTSPATYSTAPAMQFMGNGSMIVPVDTTQASRLADEKRKRNAGASARFRQRRKEKEREANNTIEELKKNSEELQERCDWYRQDRDRLRQIIIEHGLREQAGVGLSAEELEAKSSDWQQQGDRGHGVGRNQRRRLDSNDEHPAMPSVIGTGLSITPTANSTPPTRHHYANAPSQWSGRF